MSVDHDNHDHLLMFAGVWEGVAEFELVCVHDEDQSEFYKDHEGVEADECLVQLWWSEEGTDIVQASDGNDTYGALRWDRRNLKLWTHWDDISMTLDLLGIAEHNDEVEVKDVQREGDPVGVWIEAGA